LPRIECNDRVTRRQSDRHIRYDPGMTQVILVEADDHFTIVAVEGPLDIAGVGEVDLKLTTHTITRHKPAIIDLREVQILTSLAIGMLVRIAHAMRAHGLDRPRQGHPRRDGARAGASRACDAGGGAPGPRHRLTAELR